MDKNKNMVDLLSSINKKLDNVIAIQRADFMKNDDEKTINKDNDLFWITAILLLMGRFNEIKEEDEDV